MTASARLPRLRVGDHLTAVTDDGVLLSCRVTDVYADGSIRVVPEQPIPPPDDTGDEEQGQ